MKSQHPESISYVFNPQGRPVAIVGSQSKAEALAWAYASQRGSGTHVHVGSDAAKAKRAGFYIEAFPIGVAPLGYSPKKPTEPGWYWCMNKINETTLWEAVVRVERRNNRLFCIWFKTDSTSGFLWETEWDAATFWAGPIEPPQTPKQLAFIPPTKKARV